jgi:predicted Zn-dependent protease
MIRKILFLLSFALFTVQIFSATYMTEPSFSPDSKEVYYIENGRIKSPIRFSLSNAVNMKNDYLKL